MTAPEFLVIGHAVQDLAPGGDGEWRLGGAAAYASLMARNLGLRTAVLTSCSPDLPIADLLPDIEVRVVPSAASTQMRNVYDGGRRTQTVPSVASRITAADLPEEWRDTGVVLLGPVAGEVDGALAECFPSKAMIGVGAQGWLREIGPGQRVRPVRYAEWDSLDVLSAAWGLFLSDEDLAPEDYSEALAEWQSLVPVVCFTHGYGGADVCLDDEWRRIPPFAADAVDPTGAGDVFATALMVRYRETKDVWDAARFASAAASLVVEGIGVEGVPTRAAVEARAQTRI